MPGLSGASIEGVQEVFPDKQSELIRKALKGSMFMAPRDAPPIVALTGPDGLEMLPEEWDDLGLLSRDGVAIKNEMTTEEVYSWGYGAPTRTDISRDLDVLDVLCQETKLLTIGLYTGVEVSAECPDGMSGEVHITKPAHPSTQEFQGLILAIDEADEGEVFIGRYFPRLRVTGKADQPIGGQDEPLAWGITMESMYDPEAGFVDRWMFAGPGWQAKLAAMGFDIFINGGPPEGGQTNTFDGGAP